MGVDDEGGHGVLIFHRKGAKGAEGGDHFVLLSGERPESKKSAHSFRLFTIRAMPSRLAGVSAARQKINLCALCAFAVEIFSYAARVRPS
jgi:hypothetical protein